MIIAIDPILDVLVAVGVWQMFRRPVASSAPAPSKPVLSQPVSASVMAVATPSEHRALILHRQPDGSWQEIGHAEFMSRDNPGERITRELATPGRAVRWPDGTVQES